MSKQEPRVVCVILGGGKGTRLYPLTQERSKPAVSFGGKYRLVDIPISNCINSDYKKIYLLTQFNSTSLHLHIYNSYNFDRFSGGFVELLAAEQTPNNEKFYEGTADAVRKSLHHYRSQHPTHYIILSGDQLYKMDLQDFMRQHLESGAKISIATTAVDRESAGRYGIMKIDEKNRITEFREKPGPVADISDWKMPANVQATVPSKEKTYLASMGIYIFDAPVIEGLLQESDSTDFGKEIIPDAIGKCHTHAYIFDGYWEDIGTIRSFYDCNIALTEFKPAFNFYDEDQPIFTHMRNLPPSKINRATIEQSLTSEGCIISDCKLTKSVIGVRSIIEKGSELEGVIMMGSDFYENKEARDLNDKQEIPHVGIGKNCKIRETIIDKDAHIGNNVRINVDGKKYEDGDHGTFYSADGIIVIRKGAVIPDGTVI